MPGAAFAGAGLAAAGPLLRGCRGSGSRRLGRSRGGGLGCGSGGLRGGGLACGLLLGLALGLLLGLALGARLGLQAGLLLGFLASLLLLGAEDRATFGDDVADRTGDQGAGADRVVVAWNHIVDPIRIAVGVHEADDRDPQSLRLFDGDRLGFEVDDEHRVGHALHVFDAAEVGAQLREVGLRRHALARRQQRELTLALVALEIVQAADALVDRLEVGQQTTEPAVVDVGHARRLGDVLDGVTGLLLGADEQHGPAAVGELAGELAGLLEQRVGLEQVDDVDAGALIVDETAHLGVPAARLVTEVDAGLQQFRDAYFGHGSCNSLMCAL